MRRFVSVATGLTTVTVFTSSGDQPVSTTDRAWLVGRLSNVVLINSYGADGLMLGIAATPEEVRRQLDRVVEEMPGLVLTMKDVSDSDPFSYFEGWTIVPRVDKSGHYQLIVKTLTPDRKTLEELISNFKVRKVEEVEGELQLHVGHVLELISYSDRLRREPGVSLERRYTWHLQAGERLARTSRAGSDRDRVFWVRVEDQQFKSLSVAQKQYQLLALLSGKGKVRGLEYKLFGVEDNYLAVFRGQDKVSGVDQEDGLSMMELSHDALPDVYLPNYQVDGHGFYTVSGRFPENISDELKQEFADQMKKFGAVGYTGDDSVFRLHYVNSSSAEVACLSSLGQYTNFALKLNSSPVRALKSPSKEKGDNPPPASQVKVQVKAMEAEAVDETMSVSDPRMDDDKSSETETIPTSFDPVFGEMREVELLTINWQQGKTLHSALKSLAKFLVSVNIVEVFEQEDTKEIIFRFSEKKKFIKMLKIYSSNQTNSFEKLRTASPRLEFSANKNSGNMFGLLVTKKKGDNELLKQMRIKYPGVKIEDKNQFHTFWLPTKLDYYKVLVDKSFNVHFVPSVSNFAEAKSDAHDGNAASKDDDISEAHDENPKDLNENDIKTVKGAHVAAGGAFQMTEKSVFGFIWKHLEGFKVKDEQIISRQLSDFLKSVKCSEITSDNDNGLVFHFSSLEDYNAVLIKYCPEVVGDQRKFDSLTRKFTLVPSRGLYGVFSTTPVNPEDFQQFVDGKQFFNSVWFPDKMDVVRALRDEKISTLYPTLYIDCRNILVLQSIRPQQPHTPIKLSPVSLNLISPHSRRSLAPGFGRNVSFSYSQFDGRPVRLAGPHRTSRNLSLAAEKETNMRKVELYLREESSSGELVLSFSQPRHKAGQRPEEAQEEDYIKEKAQTVDLLGNQTLFIPYDAEKDVGLSDKLAEDISWFDTPVSVQEGVKSSTGQSILQIKMRNKEVTIAAYLGLKLKYPGLEIDKSGW